MRDRLFLLRSPHNVLEPLHLALQGGTPHFTSLVLIRMTRAQDLLSAREAAYAIRRAFPASSIALLLDTACDDEELILLRAHLAGIRAIVKADRLDIGAVRAQLCSTLDLPEFVIGWMVDSGVVVDGTVARALRRLIAPGETVSAARVASAARELSVSPRALTKAFAVRDLPSPRKWLALGTGLRDALTWVVSNGECADSIAIPGPSSCVRTFGVSAATLRKVIGPAFLMAAWWARCRSSGCDVPANRYQQF